MSKIEEFLRKKDEENKLLNDLARIKEKAEPLLAKIVVTFPEYTSHDISHSERILKAFDLLIPDSLFEKMNSYELYFLIASTYLHDIGMVNLPDFAEPEFDTLTGENNKKLQEIIRKRHHLRAEIICIKKYKDFSIDDPYQAEIIGRICRGHRKENLHDLNLFKNDKKYLSHSINVALLASLLRNGDELDLTFKRTPYIVYEIAPPKDKISKKEWEKHLKISGVAKDSEDDLKIKCSARCESPKIHRSLKELELKINKGIEDLSSHLYHYREVKKDIPRKFVIDIEPIGYEPYDLKFSLQEIEVMNLLMGDKLYERKEECIRELLKNAVDACRLRTFRSIKDDELYTPIIKFELNSNKLIVTDNGIGMNRYIIENYFTKIGKSFYRSEEFAEEVPDFSPVSELGIGVLSYFMIADLISIDTKTDEEDAISLEFDNVSSYFIVKKGNMKRSGTKITLSLKEEAKGINLEKEIKLFASHLEFPIKVVSKGREVSVENEEFLSNESLIKTGILQRLDLAYNTRNLYGIHRVILDKPKSILEKLLNDSQLKVHTLNIKEDFIEGKVGFLMVNELYFENLYSHMYLRSIFMPSLSTSDDGLKSLSLHPLAGNVHISYAGIHVCDEILGIPWFNSVLLVDLNLKKNILDVNVARNRSVMNRKKHEFIDFIESSLFKCIKDFLDKMKCESDFPRKAYAFMNTFIRFPNSSATENLTCNRSFLNEYYYLKKLTKDGISYIKYNDSIFETDKKIVLLTEVPLDCNLNNILPCINEFKEDHIYFVFTQNLYNIINCLIKKPEYIKILSFCDFLKIQVFDAITYKKEDDDSKIVYEMQFAYFSKHMFTSDLGFFSRTGFVFNVLNDFAIFLINNKKMIFKEREFVENFFEKLSDIENYSLNIDSIISLQRGLLSSMFEKGLISQKVFNDSILRKEEIVKYPHGFNF